MSFKSCVMAIQNVCDTFREDSTAEDESYVEILESIAEMQQWPFSRFFINTQSLYTQRSS